MIWSLNHIRHFFFAFSGEIYKKKVARSPLPNREQNLTSYVWSMSLSWPREKENRIKDVVDFDIPRILFFFAMFSVSSSLTRGLLPRNLDFLITLAPRNLVDKRIQTKFYLLSHLCAHCNHLCLVSLLLLYLCTVVFLWPLCNHVNRTAHALPVPEALSMSPTCAICALSSWRN